MNRIKTEDDLTTKVLMTYVEQKLNNTEILFELGKLCDFNIDREEICAALAFLRGTIRVVG